MAQFEGKIAQLGVDQANGVVINDFLVAATAMTVIGHDSTGAHTIGSVTYIRVRPGGELWAHGYLAAPDFWPTGVSELPARADLLETFTSYWLNGQRLDPETANEVDLAAATIEVAARIAGVSVFAPGAGVGLETPRGALRLTVLD